MESLNELAKVIHEAAKSKGFYDNGKRNIPELLCLIHSEVSEALEDYRENKMEAIVNTESGKLEGFPSELADIIIRVLDLSRYLNIDISKAVRDKIFTNTYREHMHGGKRC